MATKKEAVEESQEDTTAEMPETTEALDEEFSATFVEPEPSVEIAGAVSLVQESPNSADANQYLPSELQAALLEATADLYKSN